jgi:hypothetical protein
MDDARFNAIFNEDMDDARFNAIFWWRLRKCNESSCRHINYRGCEGSDSSVRGGDVDDENDNNNNNNDDNNDDDENDSDEDDESFLRR